MTAKKDFHDQRRRLRKFPATDEATHRKAGFMLAQELANQIANQLLQHTMARGIAGWNGSDENAQPKRTVGYGAAQTA